jgi:hypothetical protein
MIKDAEDNWDNYLKNINLDKIDQVNEEMNRYIEENNLNPEVKELYRGIVDNTNNKGKIYKYSDFKNEKYKKVDLSKISIPELRFVRHMTTYIDEVFDMDVPYYDMENVPEYRDDNVEQVDNKIVSIKRYMKKK